MRAGLYAPAGQNHPAENGSSRARGWNQCPRAVEKFQKNRNQRVETHPKSRKRVCRDAKSHSPGWDPRRDRSPPAKRDLRCPHQGHPFGSRVNADVTSPPCDRIAGRISIARDVS